MAMIRPSDRGSWIRIDEIDGVRVVIPARKPWLWTALGAVWLAVWCAVEICVIHVIRSGQAGDNPPAFLFLWLVIWTPGGAWVLVLWFWNIFGRVVLVLTDDMLIIRRELGPFRRSRGFNRDEIRDLRFVALPRMAEDSGFEEPTAEEQAWSIARFGGRLELVLTDRTIHPALLGELTIISRTFAFAEGLSEAEARRLLKALRPHLKLKDDPYKHSTLSPIEE